MSVSVDPSQKEKFRALQLEGKRLAAEGELEESLKRFELAKKICPTPKVLQRIEKLKECLKALRPQSKDSCSADSTSNCSPVEVSTSAKCSLQSTSQESKFTFAEPKVLSDIKNITALENSSVKISKPSDLSPESQLAFKKLKKEAKEFAYSGNYDDALMSFRKALSICDCSNVKRYIKEIEAVLLSNNEEFSHQTDSSTEKKSSGSIRESLNNNTKSVSLSNKDENEHLNDRTIVKRTSDSVQESMKCNTKSSLSNNAIDDTFQKQSSEKSFPSEDAKHSSKENLSVNKEEELERKLAEVKKLYEEARDLAADARLPDALKMLKKAQSIHATNKVQKKIDKLEELLAAGESDCEENQMIEVADGLSLYHEIYNKLYPYQREGVAWMWSLYKMRKGGVLGDDMGLGKTFQVIAFLSGMIDADLIKHVLVIMPVSLLKNWEKEFKKWCPGIAVYDFHSGTKKERERNLLRVQRRGHVLLTSYGMIVNNVNSYIKMEDEEFVWDYVILDEGHKIKNPTKTTKAVYEIPAKNRIVLTGTPIQNNLRELWSLYDFVHQGTLLGSMKTFKMQYENPITRSREKDATSGEKRLGSEMAENLKSLIKPYFLRRTKEEIWGKKDKDVDELGKQMDKMKISQVTTKKNDLILWTYMSEPQIAIYKDFLSSEAVKAILVSKRSPLVELTTLKKICDHPRLLSQRACHEMGLNSDFAQADDLNLDDESTMASSIDNVTDDCLLKESGKLKLVVDLLENLKENGHRTLVFSLSRKILDMIHRILLNRNWKVMRLDGTISKTEERERRIQKFQRDASYPVFLLTTQVGGVGITLTSADRVIIYDPSWNPATDAQAVDRVYRIGQAKDVVVYRLITCGTVEEKIYRRQIFKDSITRQTTGGTDPYRYFSKQELRELFSIENFHHSATQVQLHEMHSAERNSSDELEKHISFLKSLNIFGVSDHDLMFSRQIEDQTEDNDSGAISHQFIKQRVAAAHESIKMEASVVAEGLRLAGTYSRPYQESIPLPKKGIVKDAYKPPVLPHDVIDLTEDAQDDIPKREPLTLERMSDDTDIQVDSPAEKKGIYIDEAQSSSVSLKIESFSTAPERKSKTLLQEFPTNFENALDKIRKSEEFSKFVAYDEGSKIEKLRNSSFTKPSVPTVDECPSADNEMDLCATHVDISARLDVDNQKDDPTSLKIVEETSKVAENFRANVTHLINEDSPNLSFDIEEPTVSIKRGRKSCARPSLIYISDSDANPDSASNSNMSINLADQCENDDSLREDSSNSASLSFVPDSVPSTPQALDKETKDKESLQESVNETPSRSFQSVPSLLSKQDSDTSVMRKLEGNVRRITPLKVERNSTRRNSSFVQAMATSIIITPEPSPEKNENVQTVPPFETDDEGDSPLKVVNRKNTRRLYSDSENSEEEETNTEHSAEVNHEKQDGDDDDISGLTSSEKDIDSENSYNEGNLDEDHEEAKSDHSTSEFLLDNTDIDSEHEHNDQIDLDQTYATCKEKIESASESTNDESWSDESGSVFSEED